MPGNYFDQFDDDPYVVAPNPSQVARDAREQRRKDDDARRDDVRTGVTVRGEGREDRRDARSADKQSFDLARDMRTEFNKLPAVTDYQTVIRQYASALKTQPNASGDQALITAYAKMLDPGSVVREQEFNTVANADSTIGKTIARLSKELGLDQSGMLRPEIRARVRDEMQQLTSGYRKAYEQTRSDYTRNAQSYGVEPVRVVGTHLGDPYREEIERSLRSQPRNAMLQDTTDGAPPQLAAPGSDRQSIPIPPDMQAEYSAYVGSNRGRLDPDGYAAFRDRQNQQYGFPAADPATLQSYRDEALRINDDVRSGRRLNLRLPAPDKELTGLQSLNATVFNNQVGAAVLAAPPLAGGMDEVAAAVRSTALGTNYDVELARANGFRQAAADQFPNASVAGQIGGGIMGAMGAGAAIPRLATAGNTLGGTLALGTGVGGAQGALENNDDRMLGAGVGAGAGVMGGLVGRYAVAPLLERAARSETLEKGVNSAIQKINAVTGRDIALRSAPRLTGPETSMRGALPNLPDIQGKLRDAAELQLPYTLADADPRLRMLAGATTRRSVNAREMAEQTYGPRSRGQADRAVENIHEYLAPITDMGQRRDQWLRAARTASQPLYDQANAMGVQVDDELAAMLRSPAGRDALRRAKEIVENEGKDPFNVGFAYDQNDQITLRGMEKKDPFRFAQVATPNERGELTSRTIRGWNGREFTNKGPIDLVGWLRLQGGLADQGGELSHMGLGNRARGMDFAGQEHRFGPLVNRDGMLLDDAMERAWEAGYFPEFSDRPDVNTFLNAVRDTYEGRQRRFLPTDMEEVDRFYAAQADRHGKQQTRFETGRAPVLDTSGPAGPQEFPPIDAYKPVYTQDPTFETIDLTKRGLDARIEQARNPLTGRLELDNNPELQAINDLRTRFVAAADRANAIYPQARAEYEKYISRRDALDAGYEATTPRLPPRDLQYRLGTLDAPQLEEYRRGFATSMGDKVDNARLSHNPYEVVYGAPAQQEKIDLLFPDAPRFRKAYDLESDMAKTAHETLGGSPTAARLQADAQFAEQGMPEAMGNAAVQFGTGAGAPAMMTLARQALGDRLAVGMGKAGEQRADDLAAVLFDPNNPRGVMDYLDEFAARNAEIERRKAAAMQAGGLLGSFVGPQYVTQR